MLNNIKRMIDDNQLEIVALQNLFQNVFQEEVRKLGVGNVPTTINRQVNLKLTESKVIVTDTPAIIKPK